MATNIFPLKAVFEALSAAVKTHNKLSVATKRLPTQLLVLKYDRFFVILINFGPYFHFVSGVALA